MKIYLSVKGIDFAYVKLNFLNKISKNSTLKIRLFSQKIEFLNLKQKFF